MLTELMQRGAGVNRNQVGTAREEAPAAPGIRLARKAGGTGTGDFWRGEAFRG